MFATAAAAHGTLGYSITGTSGTATYVGWNGYNAELNRRPLLLQPWDDATVAADPAAGHSQRDRHCRAHRVVDGESVFVQNNAGTTVTTFPHALPANTWYRIEMTISISGTAATIKAAYYLKDGRRRSTPRTRQRPVNGYGEHHPGLDRIDRVRDLDRHELVRRPRRHAWTTSYIGAVPTAPGAPTAVTAIAATPPRSCRGRRRIQRRLAHHRVQGDGVARRRERHHEGSRARHRRRAHERHRVHIHGHRNQQRRDQQCLRRVGARNADIRSDGYDAD